MNFIRNKYKIFVQINYFNLFDLCACVCVCLTQLFAIYFYIILIYIFIFIFIYISLSTAQQLTKNAALKSAIYSQIISIHSFLEFLEATRT